MAGNGRSQCGQATGRTVTQLGGIRRAQQLCEQLVPMRVRKQGLVEQPRTKRSRHPEAVHLVGPVALPAPGQLGRRHRGRAHTGPRHATHMLLHHLAHIGARALPGHHKTFGLQLRVHRHQGVARHTQLLCEITRGGQTVPRRNHALVNGITQALRQGQTQGLLGGAGAMPKQKLAEAVCMGFGRHEGDRTAKVE